MDKHKTFQYTTSQIRNNFIDFFKNYDHEHVPSSPLVPYNDPTLMFVNSGMVQFKDVFTGAETRKYKRATSSQKSVRAGGKHNDLDNVGYTARHHTFFEMLGNFSFGDYFKEEAIYYAWQLLTKTLNLPAEKLYVTIYHDDDEAARWWKKISGFNDDKIIRIKTNDNFWSMGDVGPCGPCSEIFYDHGDKIFGGLPGTKDEDGDRYIEIWNLVFMQFEQVDKDTRIELPKKSVDTGMGLERIAAVIQGVHDNYDIDIFRDLINYTEDIVKVKAADDALSSYRVIADHLRSSAFLIADGVMPSNEGRGYVLRRIMRRAMRHAHQLGAKEPLIYKLLPKLVDLFGHTYPEIARGEEFITSILKQEEMQFKTTLSKGLKILADETTNISKKGTLSGDVAFKLYDTYGFPLDLTEDILKKQQITVDIKGFEKNMNEQKMRARAAWSGSGEAKSDDIWFDILTRFGGTEFLGHTLNGAEASVISLVSNAQEIKQISKIGEKFTLITNQTPFYGESGGQMGDIGVITSPHSKIKVIDTLKYLGKIHAHICQLEEGLITVGDEVKLTIDQDYRNYLKIHHSATHILHAVMRDVLGRHVTQKGSLVAYDKLRFDVSHPKALTNAEIRLIEDKVNQVITENSPVVTKLMLAEEAIESGAMALFGEKYDNEVRVVSMGNGDDNDDAYSFELCGGTHVARTGDIGAFKIASEGAIASGVRRIEAVCGKFAFKLISENEQILQQLMVNLKAGKTELVTKVDNLLQSKKLLEKDLAKIQMEKLNLSTNDIENKAIKLEGGLLIYQEISGVDPKTARVSAENLTKKMPNLILIYGILQESKSSIVISVSKQIADKFNAGNLAKKISEALGASGGGSSTLAQVGGVNDVKFKQLENNVKELVA
ncbi:MAG: alanine--tRNA ligase [Rickettsiaceae bacterium]|nr:alanine--tRNA ligase [Rickettsiaceae bacterium]